MLLNGRVEPLLCTGVTTEQRRFASFTCFAHTFCSHASLSSGMVRGGAENHARQLYTGGAALHCQCPHYAWLVATQILSSALREAENGKSGFIGRLLKANKTH